MFKFSQFEGKEGVTLKDVRRRFDTDFWLFAIHDGNKHKPIFNYELKGEWIEAEHKNYE